MRPPFETFKGAICKGCYALNSACGRCEKCAWERSQMSQQNAAQEKPMEPKPLSEQVNDITNVPVTTARSNVHQELKQIDDRLNRLTVPQHGLCLQMLKSMFDVREAAMKDALAEHQFKMAAAHEREQARKQAALEKEQAEIAEANKPKLAVVTQ